MPQLQTQPKSTSGLSARATEDLRIAFYLAKSPQTARVLWDEVFSPTDRVRLGGDFDGAYARHRGAVGMWVRLHGVSQAEAVIAVATRFGRFDEATSQRLLRALGHTSDDPIDLLEWTRKVDGLVLTEAPRAAYYAGREIVMDWEGSQSRSWEFLTDLANRSKAGETVGPDTYERRSLGDQAYVAKVKGRLVNLPGFPTELKQLVVPAGRGSYRLKLPAGRIKVFERGVGDAMRERVP